MRKIQYWLSLTLLLGVFLTACVDNDPKIENFESDAVSFIYSVEGDDYKNDFFYGATIAFENTSQKQGACKWYFYYEEGKEPVTSTEQKPTFVYENSGLFDVVLEIEGVGKKTGKILISDIKSIVSYTSSTDIPVNGESTISLSVNTPNPREGALEYEWVFPEGTTLQDGTPVLTSTEADPGALKFTNIGTQRLILKTKLEGRQLDDAVVRVNIGYSKEAKTLYYAVKGGNMMAYKLIDDLPAGVKNLPIDLGVKSGKHPFNIFFNESDESLYVLDAGRQYYYIDDSDGVRGDGSIFVLSKDGEKMEELLNNNGGAAFDDPFFGYIESGKLYYSDRNTGISTIPLTARDQAGSRVGTYWVQNNYLGYYGKGYNYGAINATIMKNGNVWWWAKYANTKGIYRFLEGDILSDGSGNSAAAPTSGIALQAEETKSFTFVGDQFFVAIQNKGVFTHAVSGVTAALTSAGMTKIADLPQDEEGTDAEKPYITQMVPDLATGKVYFAYRAPSVGATEPSGIKYYDPTSKTMKTLVESVQAYGITVNNKPSKLF